MKTWREYYEYNNTENTQWCMPFCGDNRQIGNFKHDFDFLILFEGKAHSLYIDGKAIHDPSEDDLKDFAKAINPDYDLYDGWDDLHIALDVMRECGCSQCPFFGECSEMDEVL